MNLTYFSKLKLVVQRFLKKTDLAVDKKSVTKDIYSEVDISVSYLRETDTKPIEKKLENQLQRKVKFNLEQVKVLKGGLLEAKTKTPMPTLAPLMPPDVSINNFRAAALSAIKPSLGKIGIMISPSNIMGAVLSFYDKGSQMYITLKIRRDAPLLEDQGTRRRL